MMTDDLIFAWHIHHNVLVEALTEPIENRRTYIRRHKPLDEVELRLQLLQPIPSHLVPASLVVKWMALQTARTEWRKAPESAAEKMYTDTYYDYMEFLRGADISVLHTHLCPDCPWDNWTIFTEVLT